MATPQTEFAVRDWLRTVPSVLALVGNDVRRIDVDYSGSPDLTHVTMFRSGGALPEMLPFDDAVMTFLCWGKGRGSALTLATTLAETLRSTREVPLNSSAYLRGARVESLFWNPSDDGIPRYAVIALVTATARQTSTV